MDSFRQLAHQAKAPLAEEQVHEQLQGDVGHRMKDFEQIYLQFHRYLRTPKVHEQFSLTQPLLHVVYECLRLYLTRQISSESAWLP